MSQTLLTRRTPRRPVTRVLDVSGILGVGISTALRKSGFSVTTWWRDHPDGRSHLARATTISRTHCLIEVLHDGKLWTVRRDSFGEDDLLALPASARALIPAGVVHSSTLIDLDDAGYALDDWLSYARLAGAWRLTSQP